MCNKGRNGNIVLREILKIARFYEKKVADILADAKARDERKADSSVNAQLNKMMDEQLRLVERYKIKYQTALNINWETTQEKEALEKQSEEWIKYAREMKAYCASLRAQIHAQMIIIKPAQDWDYSI